MERGEHLARKSWRGKCAVVRVHVCALFTNNFCVKAALSASRRKDCRRIRGGNALRNALRGRPTMQVITSIITINEGKQFSVLGGKKKCIGSLVSPINFDIVGSQFLCCNYRKLLEITI